MGRLEVIEIIGRGKALSKTESKKIKILGWSTRKWDKLWR